MSPGRLALFVSLRTARRSRAAWMVLLWATVGLCVAAARRGHGADDVIIGALGAFVVPLVSFSIAGAVSSGRSYASVVLPLVRLGAPLSAATLAPFIVACSASAFVTTLIGALSIALSRTVGAPVTDLFTTMWIAALAGAAYAAVFVAAASFGKSGGGRFVALACDLVFGSGSGLSAALTVRAHLRNLLGGSGPLEIGQRASSVALVLFIGVALAIALRRVAPPRASLRRALAAR